MAENPTSAPVAPDRLADVVRRAELQADNPRFNEQFKEELKQMKLTREELEDLAQRFESSGVERIRNDARAVILEQQREQRQDFLQNLDIKNADPRTWSKETQVKAAVAVGGVLVGGTILAVIASKIARKAGQTGRKVRNGALWLAGGIAVAAGTALGITAWKKWGEVEKLIASARNTVDKIANLPEEMREKYEKQYEETRKKLEEKAGVAGEQIDEMTGRARAAANRTEEAARTRIEPVPAETAASSPAPAEAPAPAADAVTEQAELEAQKREAAEAVERNALELTSKGLLLMFKTLAEQAGITQETERTHVAIVLNNPALTSILTIRNLRGVRTPEQAAALLPEGSTDAERKAVLFLALAAGELESRVRDTLPSGADMDALSLRQAIDRCYHMPRMFSRIQRGLQGKDWKDAASLMEGFTSAFAEDSIEDLKQDPSLAEALAALGLEKDDIGFFFAHCVANGRSTLLRQVTATSDMPQLRRVETALMRMHEELRAPQTVAYLEKYLHGRTDKAFAETFRTQISENLLVLDAVQLYSYLQLAKREGGLTDTLSEASPVGALLTQMKVIDLVGKQDKDLAKHLYTDLALETAGTAATGASAIDLPAGTREFLASVVSNGAGTLLDFGKDWLRDTYENALIGLYEFNRKNPNATMSIAGTTLTSTGLLSAIQAVRYYRLGSSGRMANNLVNTGIERLKPTNFLSWLDYTASGQDAWDPATARTRGEAIKNIDLDVIRNVPDEALRTSLNKSYNNLHYRGYSEQSFKQFFDEMEGLKRQGLPAAEIDDVVSRVKTQVYPFRDALQKRRFGFIRRQWRNALPWQRTAWAGGAALQGYAVYEDLQGIGEAWEQERKVQEHAQFVMDDIRTQLTAGGQFETVPGKLNTYRHKTSDVEVSLSAVQKTLEQGAGALDDRTMAQYLRTATSAASLTTTLFMGAKVFAGPAGLALAAVEITVRVGINAWEQGKMREFLNDAPPWLLPALGVEQTTGTAEYDWLAKGSSWMMSDLWKGDADKAELRSKMLFTIFNQDLRTYAPELFEDITRGLDAPPLLDTLYREDFKRIILPAFYIRLFETARNGGVEWQTIRQSDIDSGLVVIPPAVTLVEIREAMRDASVLYAQHLSEKRYIEALNERAALQAKGETDPVLEGVIATFGEEYALGTRLSDLPADALPADGRTRTQLLLEAATIRLNTAAGTTRDDMLRATPDLFRVPAGSVKGIENDLPLDRAGVLSFVRDPALREGLSRVFAQTTAEAEGAEAPGWKEWTNAEAWKIWLEPPVGMDRTEVTQRARIAANFVREELGMPPLPENASFDAAAQAVTEAGTSFIMKNRSSAQRSPSLERSLYGESGSRPLVFTSLRGKYEASWKNQEKLCEMLRTPRTSQPEYDAANMVAVFFEGRTQEKTGHDVVLATYVFKGPAGKEQEYRIVQQAAATSATSNSSGYMTGLPIAMSGGAFVAQDKAGNLLGQLEKGMVERAAEYAKADAASREAAEKRLTAWEQAAPERERIIAETNGLRAAAIEQAKNGGGMVYVPGAYIVDDRTQTFYQEPGTFRSRVNGTDVILPLPPDRSQPSISAAVDREKVRKPSDAELVRFSAVVNGRKYDYKIDLGSLAKAPSETFTQNDQQLARSVLTKTLNLSGHPRADDPGFVREVRAYELERLLDIATYTSSFSWSAPRYRRQLFTELLPYYEQAKSKEIFLNTLLNNLLAEKTISGSAYSRILNRMQQQY